MSNEKKNNKFYWLKLPNDFFKRHDIRIVESMENGKDYLIFYLKLLTESIGHEGRLRFDSMIPYDDKMLSVITDTNIDIVRSAVKVFISLNLMEIWDDKTIFMTEVKKMIGTETDWARKKRQYRQLTNTKQKTIKGQKKDNVRQEIDLELEIELEQDKEKELNTLVEVLDDYENYFNHFWKIYPKKVGKQKCFNWFKARKINEELFNKIITAVENQKKSQQWLKDKGQFIPNPYTWLNRGGWDDELETKENWGNWLDE